MISTCHTDFSHLPRILLLQKHGQRCITNWKYWCVKSSPYFLQESVPQPQTRPSWKTSPMLLTFTFAVISCLSKQPLSTWHHAGDSENYIFKVTFVKHFYLQNWKPTKLGNEFTAVRTAKNGKLLIPVLTPPDKPHLCSDTQQASSWSRLVRTRLWSSKEPSQEHRLSPHHSQQLLRQHNYSRLTPELLLN